MTELKMAHDVLKNPSSGVGAWASCVETEAHARKAIAIAEGRAQ